MCGVDGLRANALYFKVAVGDVGEWINVVFFCKNIKYNAIMNFTF